MATKSVATQEHAHPKENGNGLELYRNVLDEDAAETLFKVQSILALGIEATMDQGLNRALLHWPNVAETAWDMLDGIMIRAGLSDGKERPWVSANEAEAAHLIAHDNAPLAQGE